MNICWICSADGVLAVGAGWVCMEHLHEGFYEVLRQIDLLRQIHHSDLAIISMAHDFLDDFGYDFGDEGEEGEED